MSFPFPFFDKLFAEIKLFFNFSKKRNKSISQKSGRDSIVNVFNLNNANPKEATSVIKKTEKIQLEKIERTKLKKITDAKIVLGHSIGIVEPASSNATRVHLGFGISNLCDRPRAIQDLFLIINDDKVFF
jgi:hypothetical protein